VTTLFSWAHRRSTPTVFFSIINRNVSLQAGAFNPAPHLTAPAPAAPAAPTPSEAASPAPSEPAAPAEPADGGDTAGAHVLTAREQRQKVCDVLFVSITIQFCKFIVACAIAVQVHVVKQTAGCSMSLILLGCS